MKKIMKVVLVWVLALALTACQSEELDATSIYENAIANLEALDSYSMDFAMAFISNGEFSDDTNEVTMNMDLTFIQVDLTSDSPSKYYSMSGMYSDTEEAVEGWLLDDVHYYIDEYGGRYINQYDFYESSSFNFFGYIDDAGDMTATANENGYSLELAVDWSTYEEYISEMAEGAMDAIFAYVTGENSVVFTMEVNGDGYITSASLTASTDWYYDYTIDITINYNYYDFNSASLPELGNGSGTTVYGDYDLTVAYADDIIAAGYEDWGYYQYYNGTYLIDLWLKQFFSLDASYDWDTGEMEIHSAEGMYDWEYNVGYLVDEDFYYTCGFDLTNLVSNGECNPYEMLVIMELQNAYNDLASSILEQ